LIERRGEVMITVIKNATFQYFGDNTKQRDWSVVRCYGGIIFLYLRSRYIAVANVPYRVLTHSHSATGLYNSANLSQFKPIND
jgi:hypothetical protein